MGIKKALLIYLISLLIIDTVSAQDVLDQYKEAKRLFDLGQYQDARGAFGELVNDPGLGNYASFYYGVASHQLNNHQQSLDMFKQILSRYPKWEQVPEVLYWAALESFEVQSYEQGILYLVSLEDRSTDFDIQAFYNKYIQPLEVNKLKELYYKFPVNRYLGNILAKKILQQPFSERDNALLSDLTKKFNLDVLNLINPNLENEFKQKYTVGVVLPFMFSSLEDPLPVMKNKLVMDLFLGMQLANEDLRNSGINLEFRLFDTRKSGEVTSSFLDELKNSDLIIGPFYPDPIDVIREFSYKQKINMINPLTENAAYIGDNPFAFLFKPSYITSARKFAEWTKQNVEGKNTLIYFGGNERDSLFAEAYAATLAEDSFNILEFRSLDDQGSKEFLDKYIEQYEKYFYKEIADSLMELDNRNIKVRRLRREEEKDPYLKSFSFYNEEDEDEEIRLIAYENKYKIPKDSIHQILVASGSNVIVNNVLSAVATRNDSIRLFGYGEWLEFKTANYQQFERLDIQMVNPLFIDENSYNYEDLYQRFIDTFQCVPSDFHFIGYEFTYFIGNILDKNGKYFQNGLASDKYVKGYLSEGFNFQGANDNQVVPVVGVRDLEVKSLNREEYENRK